MKFSSSILLLLSLSCSFAYAGEVSFLSDTYGTTTPDVDVTGQGRITGITEWGLDASDKLVIKSFTAEGKTVSGPFGTNAITTTCTPFTLDAEDYITGYTIVTLDSDDSIVSLRFTTRQGLEFTCGIFFGGDRTPFKGDFGPTSTGDYLDFHYLTGWHIASGDYIDAIQFEFTSYDTDGDGIVNSVDTDDDNDGVLDVNDFSPFRDNVSSENSFLTSLYGTTTPVVDVTRQGRITGITDWGLDASGNLVIKSFTAAAKTVSGPFGTNAITTICTPFTLAAGDYITGFSISTLNGDNSIVAIRFTTRDFISIDCGELLGSDRTPSQEFDFSTADPIVFDYLTGWTITSSGIIEGIKLEFASFENELFDDGFESQ